MLDGGEMLPALGVEGVQDGRMPYHKLGKEVGRVPYWAFMALPVDLEMHLQGTSLLVSGSQLLNAKFRAVNFESAVHILTGEGHTDNRLGSALLLSLFE